MMAIAMREKENRRSFDVGLHTTTVFLTEAGKRD
jgi:hypothetical protein